MHVAGFSYCAEQCENKFQNLKKLYLKKKDNMAAGSSGHARLDFSYFEELDRIFGKSPIVKPLAIASSSRSSNWPPSVSQDENDFDPFNDEELNAMTLEEINEIDGFAARGSSKRKGRKRNIDCVTETINENEKKREKRHNEIISVLREGQKDFRDLMSQFLNVLGQSTNVQNPNENRS
jgi:hypothetical protein